MRTHFALALLVLWPLHAGSQDRELEAPPPFTFDEVGGTSALAMECSPTQNNSITCVFIRTVFNQGPIPPTTEQESTQLRTRSERAARRTRLLSRARDAYREVCEDADATIRQHIARLNRTPATQHPRRVQTRREATEDIRRLVQTTCAHRCESDEQCLAALDAGRRAIQRQHCSLLQSRPTTVVLEPRRRGNRRWWHGVVVSDCGARTRIRVEGSGTRWTYTQTPLSTGENCGSLRVESATYATNRLPLSVQCERLVVMPSLHASFPQTAN